MSAKQQSNLTKPSFIRKAIKGLLWLVLIVLILLLIALLGFNFYLASNKTKVLENLNFLNNGKVTFDEANISVFKNFPSATLSLKNVWVENTVNQKMPILQVEELNASLTIGQLLNQELEINAVELKKGTLNLMTDEHGQNNLVNLFKSKTNNSTNKSPEWQVLMEALNVTLTDIKVIAKDDSRALAFESQIGNSTTRLKKNGNDWTANTVTTNSTFNFNNINKQEKVNGQIDDLKMTIQTNGTGLAIDLATNNTAIQFNNSKKGTSIIGRLNQLKTKINQQNNEWIANTEMNVDVDELVFKKEGGSFVENSTLVGNFKSTIKNGQLIFDPFELQINEEKFIFEANFKQKNSYQITLENPNTHFDNTIPLLTKKLQKKLSPYHVGGAFYSKTLIKSPQKKGVPPLVVVDLMLPNNKVKASGKNFSAVKLTGKFVNRLQEDEGKLSPPKNRFRFEVDQLEALFRSFNLSTQNALLTSTKADGLVLDLDANIKGKASYISDWFVNDQFFFKKGTFELNAKINAPFQSFNDILIASNTHIQLHDFAVWYKPSNVSFPFKKLELVKKSDDANFNFINTSFVEGHHIYAKGLLKNINALLFNQPDDPTESEVHIISKKLSWSDFINLFGQHGNLKNENKKTDREVKLSMKETIRGLNFNFQPKLALEVDTLMYYDMLQLENFKTGVHFEDQNTLILEKTSFKYDQGTVEFSAKLNIGKKDKTPFEFELSTTKLNLKKLLPAFDYFNVKLLADLENLPDDVKIHVKHKGIIDDHSGIITNSSEGEITIESQAHNGTFVAIKYYPNKDQSKLKTRINLEGDPSLFNEFFKTEAFFFSEGRFNVELSFLGDLKSKAHLMTETVAKFSMRDASVYYKPADVNFPLKQVDLNLKQDNADFSFFIRSDAMNFQILFEGAVQNLSEIIIGNTGKTIKMDLNVHSPNLEWATFLEVCMAEGESVHRKADHTEPQAMDVSNIKATVRGLMRTFNPTINLSLDKFVFTKDLTFDKLNASLYLQDSTFLVLDNTSFNFHDSHIQMNGKVDLNKKDKTPFETVFTSKNLDIPKLLKGLDYLNLPSLRSIEKLSGKLDMDFDFKGTIAEGGQSLINEETVAVLGFKLKEVEVSGFKNLDIVTKKLRMRRRFANLKFATLADRLTIKGNEIEIPLMEVQSNAASFFIEGKLSYGDNTNIWLSVPNSNLKFSDHSVIPKPIGYAAAGRKTYVEVTSDAAGANHYKLRFRKKRFYKTRGIVEQYRKDKKKWRRERRLLRRQK